MTTNIPVSAINALRNGEVIAFPTETVYVVGADVSSQSAVEKLFSVKKRPKFDPLIVHISEPEQVKMFAASVPEKAKALMDSFWPGALTTVLRKLPSCPDIVTAGMPGVSLRLPSNPLALELLREYNAPIAAASANTFGNVSPTEPQHVRDDLGNGVAALIDGGPSEIGIETTVVSFLENEPVVLRPGAIPIEDIEKAIGEVKRSFTTDLASFFPGMSDHNYPSHTITLFRDDIDGLPKDLRIGLLTFFPARNTGMFSAVEVLSQKGDLKEAAHNLFSAMRRLDSQDLDLIVVQHVPDTGLGVAINDRLARACFS
jgi:L-threonylcarbamoyladenylate synthase